MNTLFKNSLPGLFVALSVAFLALFIMSEFFDHTHRPSIRWLESPITARHIEGQPEGTVTGHWTAISTDPRVDFDVEIGLRDDGIVVWRKK